MLTNLQAVPRVDRPASSCGQATRVLRSLLCTRGRGAASGEVCVGLSPRGPGGQASECAMCRVALWRGDSEGLRAAWPSGALPAGSNSGQPSAQGPSMYQRRCHQGEKF